MHRYFLLISCALLLACSGAHTMTPHGSLPTKSVPRVTEEWRTADSVVRHDSPPIPLVYAAGDAHHCDQQQIACFNRCWEKYPPYPVERGNKGQYIYCTSKCLEEYQECVKDAETPPRTFPTKKAAMEWLKQHKTEILLGTLVFVGGTAFIIGTGGAGALILIPVAVL